MSEPGKSHDAVKPLQKMYKYSPSLPRRVLAHAYHFLQEKKMFPSLTFSSPSKNVFYQWCPPPGGWENTFFERRRKCELSEHFLLLRENVRRGLPPHFQLKLQSVKLPKMWFFSFLVHPVYYADAIFSWKVCIVSFSNCFCNLISSDVMSI